MWFSHVVPSLKNTFHLFSWHISSILFFFTPMQRTKISSTLFLILCRSQAIIYGLCNDKFSVQWNSDYASPGYVMMRFLGRITVVLTNSRRYNALSAPIIQHNTHSPLCTTAHAKLKIPSAVERETSTFPAFQTLLHRLVPRFIFFQPISAISAFHTAFCAVLITLSCLSFFRHFILSFVSLPLPPPAGSPLLPSPPTLLFFVFSAYLVDFPGSTCLCLFSLLFRDQSSVHEIRFYFSPLSAMSGKQMPLRLGGKIKIIAEKDVELQSQHCPVLHLPVPASVFASNRRALPFSCMTWVTCFTPWPSLPSCTLALLSRIGLAKSISRACGAQLAGKRTTAWGLAHKICANFFLLEIWDL